jgi:hypothetical protein
MGTLGRLRRPLLRWDYCGSLHLPSIIFINEPLFYWSNQLKKMEDRFSRIPECSIEVGSLDLRCHQKAILSGLRFCVNSPWGLILLKIRGGSSTIATMRTLLSYVF